MGTTRGVQERMQWKNGRSAEECVGAWVGLVSPSLPAEVERLLGTSPDFGRLRSWSAEPEAQVRFDDFPGEPSNVDLLVQCEDQRGRFVIAVEAKADEPFSVTLSALFATALERRIKNPRSRGVDRIAALASGLLQGKHQGSSGVGDLRYQLFTGVAAAITAAKAVGARRTVFLVHEFVTDATSDEKHRANALDLDCFIARLGGAAHATSPSSALLGPFRPRMANEVALYVGKATRNIRLGKARGSREG